MKRSRFYILTILFMFFGLIAKGQTPLNGRFYISGASETPTTANSNYSIEGTFTDPLFIYSASDVLPGDMIADNAGQTYRIDKIVSISRGKLTLDVTYLKGAPYADSTYPTSYATGTLFRPTKNGYGLATFDPENVNENLKIAVLNAAIQDIDKDIRGFKSGTEAEMPQSPKPGDLFYNVTEKKLYAYTDSGWVPVGGGVIASGTSAEFPNPAKAGEMFFNKDDNNTYIYNGAIWFKISTNGSTPSGIGNPDPLKVSVKEGDLFYNSLDRKLYVYAGTTWMAVNNALRDGQIFVGNASNVAVSVPLTGDATITSAGKLTIKPRAITDDKLDKDNIPLSGFGSPLNDVKMGDFKLTNLGTPANDSDAATKNYVDVLFQTPGILTLPLDNLFIGNTLGKAVPIHKGSIPLNGFGKPTGPIAMGTGATVYKITNMADPTADQDATTKKYVDTRTVIPTSIRLGKDSVLVGSVSNKAVVTAKNQIHLNEFGAPAADLSMGNFKLINLAEPTVDADAVTKKYVDGKIISPTSLSLTKGNFFIGDANGKAADVLKSTIPLSGFGAAIEDVSVGGRLLTNVATPVGDADASTKKYVDDLFKTPSSLLALPLDNMFLGDINGKALAIPKSGIPVSGFAKAINDINMGDATKQYKINFLSDPILAHQAATKNYVDTRTSTPGSLDLPDAHILVGNAAAKAVAIAKSDVPVSDFGDAKADIVMGDGTTNFKITSLADPAADQDAATKKYVDSKSSKTPIGPTEPGGAKAGDTYYNTADNRLYVYNGTKWMPLDNKLLDGHLYVGNRDSIAISTPKKIIPLSGFGSAQADIAMGDFNLTGLAEPIANQDAATKKYVDSKTVKTPTGLTPPINPVKGDTYYNTGDNHLYVYNGTEWVMMDNKLATGELYVGNAQGIAESTAKDKVLISGFGKAKANVELGDGTTNFKIVNLADPAADQDAATKKYVDAGVTKATAEGKDNLGNHQATDNLKLSAFSISNKGNNGEGLSFDVKGNASFGQDVTVNGNLYTPSDRNLKTHIETLTTVLQKINQIRGVSFEYKDQTKYATGVKIGVIAQELQKVYPGMVTKGKDGFLKVDYTQLTGMLIQAVKEQQEEIDGLKIRMDKQQEQINNILKKMQ